MYGASDVNNSGMTLYRNGSMSLSNSNDTTFYGVEEKISFASYNGTKFH